MNEQTNETKRRGRPKKEQTVTTPVMSDYEMDKLVREWERKHGQPLHVKIWEGFLGILGIIVYAFSLILGFIIGIGGCILEFIWIAIAFLLGWWLLSGIWNWIF